MDPAPIRRAAHTAPEHPPQLRSVPGWGDRSGRLEHLVCRGLSMLLSPEPNVATTRSIQADAGLLRVGQLWRNGDATATGQHHHRNDQRSQHRDTIATTRGPIRRAVRATAAHPPQRRSVAKAAEPAGAHRFVLEFAVRLAPFRLHALVGLVCCDAPSAERMANTLGLIH